MLNETCLRSKCLRLVRYIYHRKYLLGLFIVLFSCLHLIQTGLFLWNHFAENIDRNHLIKLDRITWQHAHQIPRHIHQIWLSTITHEPIYHTFRQASTACISLHPNYNYTLWTEELILPWLNIHYSWFVPIYENYRYDMQRIDAMKYFLLFHFGGIYIDLDVKCNAQDLITAMIPMERRENEPDIIFHMGTEGISANTDILAAKKHHPFFKLVLSQLPSSNRWFYLYHLTIILSAGPTFLYGVYRQYPWKDDFYYIPNHLLYGKLIEGVGGGTWYGKDSVLLFRVMEKKFQSSCFLLLIIGSLYLGYRYYKKKMTH